MKSRVLSGVSGLVALFLAFLLLCPTTGGTAAAAVAVSSARLPQDIYTTHTYDGVDLKMWRFRPTTVSPLREGAQPIILMPGMACNFDFFDTHTPDGMTYDEQLPADPADWAEGDAYLRDVDPMRYYSLAYYLWVSGYDVWMANYRGQGRDEVRSGGATGYAIDELGIYDMPAIIGKVREVNGQKPVWIGHSMGGVMANMYLEGARFSDMDDPDSSVVSDPALAAERNDGDGPQALKGFVSLDGPAFPCGSIHWLLQGLLYLALYVPFNLDLRPLTSNFGGVVASPVLALEQIFRQVWAGLGYPDLPLPLNFLPCFVPENLNPNLAGYFFTYGADGFSSRAVVQFLDACENGKMREDYRNGTFNWWRLYPPTPAEGDGYYYYSDHLDQISLPTFMLIDETRDITNPEDVKLVYDAKTRDPRDAYYIVPGSAHADIVMGFSAPSDMFPRIGAWLKSLETATVTPTSAAPGEAVTITGSSFGSSGTVSFGGVPAPVTSWSDNKISAVVPEGAHYGTVSVTNPGGTVSSAEAFMPEACEYYFAEGYTGAGSFKEYLCLGNPGQGPAHALVTYMFPGGETLAQEVAVPAGSRATVDVNAAVGADRDVSALVTCDREIVAERPMYFDYAGWTGGSCVVGAPAPGRAWYFAEGYTGPGFDEYVCVLNPGDTQSDLTFRFQTAEAGEVVRSGYTVGPHARATFKVNDLLGEGYQASLALSASSPVVAERSLYFCYQGAVTGGSCVVGATSLSNQYYFAEGTTRPGFHQWLTLQNPGASAINVSAIYRPSSGQGSPVFKTYTVGPGERSTVFVPAEVETGRDVSTELVSSAPFLAERPVYFDYAGLTGGHCVIGASAPADDWFFAEGCTGSGFSEWLCLANFGTSEAAVELAYLTREAGALPAHTLKVPAGSRVTVSVNADAGEGLELSARLRVTSGPPVVAERPMIFNYGGSWSGGSCVVGFTP